jgi:hypothetical protein
MPIPNNLGKQVVISVVVHRPVRAQSGALCSQVIGVSFIPCIHTISSELFEFERIFHFLLLILRPGLQYCRHRTRLRASTAKKRNESGDLCFPKLSYKYGTSARVHTNLATMSD